MTKPKKEPTKIPEPRKLKPIKKADRWRLTIREQWKDFDTQSECERAAITILETGHIFWMYPPILLAREITSWLSSPCSLFSESYTRFSRGDSACVI